MTTLRVSPEPPEPEVNLMMILPDEITIKVAAAPSFGVTESTLTTQATRPVQSKMTSFEVGWPARVTLVWVAAALSSRWVERRMYSLLVLRCQRLRISSLNSRGSPEKPIVKTKRAMS